MAEKIIYSEIEALEGLERPAILEFIETFPEGREQALSAETLMARAGISNKRIWEKRVHQAREEEYAPIVCTSTSNGEARGLYYIATNKEELEELTKTFYKREANIHKIATTFRAIEKYQAATGRILKHRVHAKEGSATSGEEE